MSTDPGKPVIRTGAEASSGLPLTAGSDLESLSLECRGATSKTLVIEMGKYRRVESEHPGMVASVCSARVDLVLPL